MESSGLVRAWRPAIALLVAVLASVGACKTRSRDSGLPPAGSEAYEATVRHFFRGLAKLEVGLLGDAVEELTRATELAPEEPAAWANLGLAHASQGEFDAAAPAIARAAELAPASADLSFLRARVASLTGDRETAIAILRRAVESDAGHLQARAALVREVEDAGGPGDDDEAQRLLEALVALQPDNQAVVVDRARLAAKRGDAPLVADSLRRLEPFVATWPPAVVEQLRAAELAVGAGELPAASRAIAFLRNLLLLEPQYREHRAIVYPPDPLIAQPMARFLRLPPLPARPSPADDGLTFPLEAVGEAATTFGNLLLAVSLDGVERPAVFAGGARELRRLDAPGTVLRWSGGDAASPPTGVAALDWNHDFRMDLVVTSASGVRLFLQGADGRFNDETAVASERSGPLALDATGAWAADIEMDGDLDIVVGVRAAPPTVLRNNGDGTWWPTRPLAGVSGLREFVWGDFDDDGDPDAALLDGSGVLHLFANLQAGRFAPLPAPASGRSLDALAAGDVDADGSLDLVTLAGGVVRRASRTSTGWSESALADWPEADRAASAPGSAKLILADLDNNGALDLAASGPELTTIWLAGEDLAFHRLATTLPAAARAAVDLDADGRLDLVGFAEGRVVRSRARGSRDYHFHVVHPRAQPTAGDQRINSFGVGGVVEARAGLWVQKQLIAGPSVHFGLGARTAVDVTRVVWPNGVPQAEFDPAVDRPIVAEQRLKGSCPWIFAFDGTGMRFVTDFLWRSPLGLRLNAQETAGVTQTEDWVKIRGDQLVARDGVYDIRISAELWETHFVDRVALLVVDRPDDVEVFVDERFVPVSPPALAVHATRPPRPFLRARDERGRDVTELVARRDGRYLDTFELGRYQGIAEDHYVELELPDGIVADPGGARADSDAPRWLVAHGWVYPTDSSINVAIGQGGRIAPRSLALEAQGADGRWIPVAENLGFPAGKSKTILLDLGLVRRAGVVGARWIRLRTNLEIYWDSLGHAAAVPDARLTTRRLDPVVAELRYRGYSETTHGRRAPELPDYARIANRAPRWRDLAGFYTRFGDVRPLLAEAEDRYLIMNAGDELRLSFAAPPPPERGRARDFVLVGDGWVKDGDFNTTYSRTVHPLPEHGRSEYDTPAVAPTLEEDPVYRRHREDWTTFHTRFVAPRGFVDGLARAEAERRR